MNGKVRSQTVPTMPNRSSVPFRTFSLNLEGCRASARIPIARGGFSDVFKFSSPVYGVVAVKRLRFNETERDALEAMVAKEARVLTMINHPHILPFLGISYLDDAICIVSPWAENGSLSSYLARNPEADRLGLLTQVASALAYLHTNAGDIIIHGDLHVDNILISHMQTALLSDFGLSRIVPEGNSSSLYRGDSANCCIGRVVYEAPELHDGEPRSWATDVFAFGMLVFHSYAGKQPFAKATNYLAAVVALYKGDRPERGEIQRRDFTDGLWDLVQRCWGHRPKLRPRMPEVSRRMQALLDQRDQRSTSVGHSTSPHRRLNSLIVRRISPHASGLVSNHRLSTTLQITPSIMNGDCKVLDAAISDVSLQRTAAGRRGICEYRSYYRKVLSLFKRGFGEDSLLFYRIIVLETPIPRFPMAQSTIAVERSQVVPVYGRMKLIFLVVLATRTTTTAACLSEGHDKHVGNELARDLGASQSSRPNSDERFSVEKYSADVWTVCMVLPMRIACMATMSLENLIRYIMHVLRRNHCQTLAIVYPVPSQYY